MNNKCIVIGADHHNTLGIVRSLGRKGVYSDLIIVPSCGHSYVSKSKYVQDTTILNSVEDVVPTLLQKATLRGEKGVIICCSDLVASVLDLSYDELKKYYFFPNSSKGSGFLTNVMNKEVMIELAKKSGLPVPKSWDDYSTALFPCFIKPLISKDGSKSDIAICKTEEDLERYLNTNHVSTSFQIQEYIDKDFEFQLIGLSINSGEHIIIPGVSKIIRSSETSNTGYLSYEPLDYMDFTYLEECYTFIKNLGFSGLFSIEFLRDKNGNDFFMEINLRNDGNAICATSAGVNLPYLWFYYNLNSTFPSDSDYRATQIIKVLPEFDDFFLLKRRMISFKEWWSAIKESDCYMEFDKKDFKPFVFRIWQLATHKY